MRVLLVDEAIELVKPHLQVHWEQTEVHKDDIDLAPDWEVYRSLGDRFFAVGCFDDITKYCIGYMTFFIAPHPHAKRNTFATSDAFYVAPDFRKAGIGEKLIDFAEDELLKRGVDVIMVTMRAKRPFIPLLEKLGYNENEIVYSKFIGT